MRSLIQTYAERFDARSPELAESRNKARLQFDDARAWLENELPLLLSKATEGPPEKMMHAFASAYRDAMLRLVTLEVLSEPNKSSGQYRGEWLPSILEAKWGTSVRSTLAIYEAIYGQCTDFPALHLPRMKTELSALVELVTAKKIDSVKPALSDYDL